MGGVNRTMHPRPKRKPFGVIACRIVAVTPLWIDAVDKHGVARTFIFKRKGEPGYLAWLRGLSEKGAFVHVRCGKTEDPDIFAYFGLAKYGAVRKAKRTKRMLLTRESREVLETFDFSPAQASRKTLQGNLARGNMAKVHAKGVGIQTRMLREAFGAKVLREENERALAQKREKKRALWADPEWREAQMAKMKAGRDRKKAETDARGDA